MFCSRSKRGEETLLTLDGAGKRGGRLGNCHRPVIRSTEGIELHHLSVQENIQDRETPRQSSASILNNELLTPSSADRARGGTRQELMVSRSCFGLERRSRFDRGAFGGGKEGRKGKLGRGCQRRQGCQAGSW